MHSEVLPTHIQHDVIGIREHLFSLLVARTLLMKWGGKALQFMPCEHSQYACVLHLTTCESLLSPMW